MYYFSYNIVVCCVFLLTYFSIIILDFTMDSEARVGFDG